MPRCRHRHIQLVCVSWLADSDVANQQIRQGVRLVFFIGVWYMNLCRFHALNKWIAGFFLANTFLLCAAFAASASAEQPQEPSPEPPHKNQKEADVAAHYVRMEGIGLEKTAYKVFESARTTCETILKIKGISRTLEPLPPGEAPVKLIDDVYYTTGGITTYHTVESYMYDTECAKLIKKRSNPTITMRTTQGFCKIVPSNKFASGNCDETAMRSIDNRAYGANPYDRPTGRTENIAGLSCKVYQSNYQKFNSVSCIHTVSGELQPAQTSSGQPIRGIYLSNKLWTDLAPENITGEMKATKVQLDMMVSMKVLAPHTQGGYKIMDLKKLNHQMRREKI